MKKGKKFQRRSANNSKQKKKNLEKRGKMKNFFVKIGQINEEKSYKISKKNAKIHIKNTPKIEK